MQQIVGVERMGMVAYAPMLALQKARHAAVLAGTSSETLFLLEHTPVFTLGKNTGAGHVLVPQAELQKRGIDLFKTSRGGDVTYHGPGQITGYPILSLKPGEQDIQKYVFKLEEVMIRSTQDFGITAERLTGMRGIWVKTARGYAKVGAIGVRIARWVTMHGFALNVGQDMSNFGLIVACGIADKGVTSLGQLLGASGPTIDQVNNRLVHHFSEVMGRDTQSALPSVVPHVAPGQVVDDLPLDLVTPPAISHESFVHHE